MWRCRNCSAKGCFGFWRNEAFLFRSATDEKIELFKNECSSISKKENVVALNSCYNAILFESICNEKKNNENNSNYFIVPDHSCS